MKPKKHAERIGSVSNVTALQIVYPDKTGRSINNKGIGELLRLFKLLGPKDVPQSITLTRDFWAPFSDESA